MVDVLQVKCTVLHAYMNILEQCMGLECSDFLSTANLEDHSMVIDDIQNPQQIYHLIPSSLGQFPTFQDFDSSVPSDLQDEDTTNKVSMALQDNHSSSAKVS